MKIEYEFGARRLPYLGLSIEQLILILYPTLLIPAVFLWQRDIRRRRSFASAPPGCVRLGFRGESHMKDELDAKYTVPPVDSGETPDLSALRIKSCFIYPIKSCAGIEVDEGDIDGTGFVWDRKFAFAELLTPQARLDAPESARKPQWTFRTLRQPGWEKLVHVKPEIWVPVNTRAVPSHVAQSGGVMIVRYPLIATGFLAPLDKLMIKWGLIPADRSFSVPLSPPANHAYPAEEVKIWGDTPRWLNMGQHLPDDLRTYLGMKHPITLFRADPTSLREVHQGAPGKDQIGYQPSVGFPDEYPLHLLNLASVRDVGEKVKDHIPRFSAKRFRGNFIISGAPAYDEDDWKRVRIGQHEFYCVCHTVRCRLPNVDPDTSERHPIEPDKTLKSFRCIDDGDPLNACMGMGMQLVPATDKIIQIRVGDVIELLERGSHRYIKS